MDTIDQRARLVLVGGFLGSGKTTMILGLAKHLVKKGVSVGIVTNDQGSKLVDTEYLASQGLPVYDVKGGCFCSRFDELEDRINELEDSDKPDVILCEPIGSAIGLISSLLKPMNEGKLGDYRLSPYCTLVDPLRAKRYFQHRDDDRLTAIDYIFEKQLNEADLIYLNKCDTLSQSELDDLLEKLNAFSNAEVSFGSVTKGENVEELYAYLLGHSWQDRSAIAIQSTEKMAAMSQLSWYNATYKVAAKGLKGYGMKLMEAVQECIKDKGQIAHVKAFISAGTKEAKYSMVNNEDRPMASGEIDGSMIQILLNGRVMMDYKALESAMEKAINRTNQHYGARMLNYDADCYAPGAAKS